MGRIRQVRQDDGTAVPFRERRIADAVAAALSAAGTRDQGLADELAGVVVLFLEKYHGEDVPWLRDVAAMVVRVLDETGHAAAARAYEEIQRRSASLRQELVIRGGSGGEAAEQPFSRELLAARVREHHEMPAAIAEDVAASVERQIVLLGHGSIGLRLLDALIEEDLRQRGLGHGLEAGASISLPRGRIAAWIRGEGEGSVGRRIAEEVLEEYSLFDLHAREVAEAHRDGRIFVHGLGAPLRVERLVVDTGLLRLDAPGGAGLAQRLLGLRRCLEALRAQVRGGILLPDLVSWLAREARARGCDPGEAAELLIASLAHDQTAHEGPEIVLWLPFHGPALEDPVVLAVHEALFASGAAPAGLVPVLVLEPGLPFACGAHAARILELAAARGTAHLVVRREGAPPLAPGGSRPPHPLRVSLGRVALNLPLLVARARPADLNQGVAALEPAIRTALRALAERYWLQRSGPREGLHAIAEILGGPGWVQIHAEGQEADLEVSGLGLALDLLVASRAIRPQDRAHAASRILAFLDYVGRDDHGGVRFELRIGALHRRTVRQRFFEAARAAVEESGDRVLEACLLPETERATILPVVVPLLDPRNAPLLEASFAERLGPGLALPLAALGEGDPLELLARLAEGSRIGLLGLLGPRPEEALIEVQEELF
jgi:hypothetical protein